MALPVRMADSVQPHLIPQTFAKSPNGVLLYADGAFACPPAEAARWPRKRWITVARGGWNPHGAWELDVETGDATPEQALAFVRMKLEQGRAAGIYCDRSSVPDVVASVSAYSHEMVAEVDWHIATLDSHPWGPGGLCAWLRSQERPADLRPERIWAIQTTPMGTYDVSTVFGRPDWER